MQDFTAPAGPQGCPPDGLIAFLTARLDEREARALAVLASTARSRESTGLGSTLWDEQDEDARRELREVEAMRGIIVVHAQLNDSIWCQTCDPGADPFGDSEAWYPCRTMRLLAAVWRDHSDYRLEWAA